MTTDAKWIAQLAELTAAWWADLLRGPAPSLNHDAAWHRDGPEHAARASMGDMLISKLRKQPDEKQVCMFERKLTSIVALELASKKTADAWVRLEVDYDPDQRLLLAMQYAGVQPGYALPFKTRSYTTQLDVQVSRGYGAKRESLVVTRVAATNDALRLLLEEHSPWHEPDGPLAEGKEPVADDVRRSLGDAYFDRSKRARDNLFAALQEHEAKGDQGWNPDVLARWAWEAAA